MFYIDRQHVCDHIPFHNNANNCLLSRFLATTAHNHNTHTGQQLLGRVLDLAQLAPVMHGVEGTVAVVQGVCPELDHLRSTFDALPDVLTEVCVLCIAGLHAMLFLVLLLYSHHVSYPHYPFIPPGGST